MIPTQDSSPSGLHLRYHVEKADGTPVDPRAEYFVLRVDAHGNREHALACRLALATYADFIEKHVPHLAADLRHRYDLPPSFTVAWEEFSIATLQTNLDHGFKMENDGEQIALMHSELSEALEGIRKDLADDKLIDRPAVEVELADCVIRIMNYGRSRGLDIAGAIIAKAAYNKTRPHLHGGKKF